MAFLLIVRRKVYHVEEAEIEINALTTFRRCCGDERSQHGPIRHYTGPSTSESLSK
jgi:hypothetical protein